MWRAQSPQLASYWLLTYFRIPRSDFREFSVACCAMLLIEKSSMPGRPANKSGLYFLLWQSIRLPLIQTTVPATEEMQGLNAV